jgi:hypothetical protein
MSLPQNMDIIVPQLRALFNDNKIKCLKSLNSFATNNKKRGNVKYRFSKTNSMKQNSSWEANSRSASEVITHDLWNSKVHYCDDKSPLLALILSQMNHVHTFLKINFNIILPSTPLSPKWSYPSGFLTRILCAFLIWQMYFMWSNQLILPELIEDESNILRTVMTLRIRMCDKWLKDV